MPRLICSSTKCPQWSLQASTKRFHHEVARVHACSLPPRARVWSDKDQGLEELANAGLSDESTSVRDASLLDHVDLKLLHHVYNFEDRECNVSQDLSACKGVALSLCGCISQSSPTATTCVAASSVASSESPSYESVDLLCSTVQSIQWFPEYGAALFAMQPGSSDFAPFQVICLDQWQAVLHRSYCDGPQLAPQLQHTAVCKSSAVHTITADLPPSKSSLPRLASLVRRILQHSDTSTKKAPRSAGFFAHVVARTADALTSQPLEVLLDDVAGLYDEMMSSAAGMGSFQEVGRTAGSERMPTCWPLVREAFRFVAKQAGILDPDMLLCHFHIQNSVALCDDAKRQQGPPSSLAFSAVVGSLREAAHSLADAASGCADNTAGVQQAAAAISSCRQGLDEAMRLQQQRTLMSSLPGQLSFEDEVEACKPFPTMLPPPAPATSVRASADKDKPLLNLDPLPSLTFQESHDINYLFPWISSFPDTADHHALSLVLHMIERWFFSHALHGLDAQDQLSACEVALAGDLLTTYSRKLLNFESKFARSADCHTDILSVELRSRETLVTWIAMCLAHQQAASEWPELLQFALPVRADSLRHLVLSDGQAVAALQAVVAYVSSVHCRSKAGPVFSTRTDATIKLASQFTRSSEVLTRKLNEEIRVSVARIDEHWDAVLQKQQLVRELQNKQSVVQDRLENAKIDKAKACEALDQKIRDAASRADDLKSKTAYHKSQVISTIMEFYNRSRVRSAEDAEKDQKVKAANAAWRKGDAYVQQLRSERKHGCPAGGSPPGVALHRAQQDIAAAERQVQQLAEDLDEAQVVPARVWQALPDCRLPGASREAAQAILYFLHPEHAGTLPLLQQLCCAAQQGVIPWPVRSRDGVGWDASSLLAREPAHASWREFYHSTHATAAFQQRMVWFEQDEDPEQLNLFTTFHAPTPAELGSSDVMAYRSKLDGVWFPKPDGLRLIWRGGPVARYSSSMSVIDPFADCSDHPEAAAQAFTEPGQHSYWLLTHAWGPSRLCQQQWAPTPSVKTVGCACSQGPRLGGSTIHDRPATFELTRGNRSLTQQADRHPGMSADQWLTFAQLRAYPHTQLRRLCVGLREGTLLLDSPQVCAAVRMALYHTGQLERTKAGMQASCISRAWHDFHNDLAALCRELHQWQQHVLYAPKFLHQALLMCEMAAFVAAAHEDGPAVAEAYKYMALTWASLFEAELRSLESEASDDAGSNRPDVQSKCSLAHALVVLCHGASSMDSFAAADRKAPQMSTAQVKRLCFHMVQAKMYSRSDCSRELNLRLQVVLQQCARVMACHIHVIDDLLHANKDILSHAARGVFRELPEDATWRPVDGALGCYVTHYNGSAYSVNLLCGQALRNGRVPGHLPSAILEHPSYKRAFGQAMFEVIAETQGDHLLFRSARSVNGRLYSWMLAGQRLVVCETPVDATTGRPLHEAELELLPHNCEWCPALPQRLKQLHSHWISRRAGAIFLRGKAYDSHTISFLLTPVGGPQALETACYVVPSHRQTEPWQSLLTSSSQLQQMWPAAQDSTVVSLLTRFEARQFIHVTSSNNEASGRPHVLQYLLPRFRLEFHLAEGADELASVQYAGYLVQSLPDETPQANPVLPPGLQEFLVLHHCDPGVPCRVLIPDGSITAASKSSGLSVAVPAGPGSAETQLQHHALTLHPRTCHLDTAVVQSRLFLAALHAAADMRVPQPRLGMTGGEHALHLLRRCHISRPLTTHEARTLQSLCSFAAHTPALSLACTAMLDASQALSFLHDSPGPAAAAAVRPEEILLYRQELRQAEESGFANARRLLETAEAAQFACEAPSMPRHVAVVEWHDLDDTMGTRCRQAVSRAHECLHQISARHLLQTMSQTTAHLQCMRPGLQRLQGTAHGRDVVKDHDASIAALLASPRQFEMEGVDLLQLQSELMELCTEVDEAVAVSQQWLLGALAHGGSGVEGAVLRAMQSAGAVCIPALADLIQITLFPELLQEINPLLTVDACKRIKQHALFWQELCVLQDKLSRCIVRCNAGTANRSAGMDASLSALEQELRNKRAWEPSQHPEWLAFEVLQGLEIRHTQYVVAKHMLDNHGSPGMGEQAKGAIIQLNMGEGKTRVILPMLVLALCGRGELVRLNFLQELLPEAVDYLHSCLTGTLLQVKLLSIPFSRDVEMDDRQLQLLSRQMRRCMTGRAFVCVSREHRMSLQLKAQELLSRGNIKQHALLNDLLSLPGWDILDECDQLLSHKFQLVYAWGSQSHLPSLEARVQMAQAVLEALALDARCQELLSNRDIAQVRHHTDRIGSMPHVRLIPGAALQARLPDLHKALCKALYFQANVQLKELAWLTALGPDCYNAFQECCMSPFSPFDGPAEKLGISEDCAEREQVLALRGLIGMQVLEHTLQRRHRVDFGLTDRVGPGATRMAVPFRACDTPSERAEFKHPDAAICKTQLAYYQTGLQQGQLRDALQAILSLPLVQGRQVYREAVRQSRQHLTDATEIAELHGMDDVAKIDLTNSVQFQGLQKHFGHNFRIINFWLSACVLPRETRQFPGSLRCSAWHVASNKSGKVVGFSGTVDNRSLLPLQVEMHDTGVKSIRGTNGRMISTMLLPGKCTFVSLDQHVPAADTSNTPVSMQVLQFAVDQGANAIIDAGAQLADMELQDVAQHLVNALTEQQRRAPQSVTAVGVVFFQSAGKAADANRPHSTTQAGWFVMDMRGRVMPKDRCPIVEADAFVLFDEAHCRGSDMKLRPDATAVLTLGPHMGRDKLMQAAARMRQLEKQQTVMLLGTDEACRSIRETCGVPVADSIQPKDVVEWVMWNTAEANVKGFGEYLLQGKHYAASLDKEAFADEEVSDLMTMYKEPDRSLSVMEFLQQPLTSGGAPVALSVGGKECMALMQRHAEPFSFGAAVGVPSVVDEFERDVELQQEQEQERELEQEQRVPVLDTSREHTWENVTAAISLPSASRFASQQSVAAVPVVEGLKLLPRSMMALVGEQEIMSSMNWPASVLATHNFLHASSQRAVVASHVRKVDAILLFPDGSALLLSERECENVVTAMLRAAADDVRVLLVHLAFSHDLSITNWGKGGTHGGDECLSIGDHRLLEHPFVMHRAQQVFAAASLFNGETDFVHDLAASKSGRGACRTTAMRRLVFGVGDRRCGRTLSGREGRDAAHQLVRMREQDICWPGSTLEAVCLQQLSAENVARGEQHAMLGWSWISSKQPFSEPD